MCTLSVETGNAAFKDAGVEVEAAEKIEWIGEIDFALRDINSNSVGRATCLAEKQKNNSGPGVVTMFIETDNAAFEGAFGCYEVVRILRVAAEKISGDIYDFALSDINGNTVGLVETTY